jgi:hypothetical protein
MAAVIPVAPLSKPVPKLYRMLMNRLSFTGSELPENEAQTRTSKASTANKPRPASTLS